MKKYPFTSFYGRARCTGHNGSDPPGKTNIWSNMVGCDMVVTQWYIKEGMFFKQYIYFYVTFIAVNIVY